jgi:hypothetical protein
MPYLGEKQRKKKTKLNNNKGDPSCHVKNHPNEGKKSHHLDSVIE